MDKERGPVEQEIYDLIRGKGQADPALLNAKIEGRSELSDTEWIGLLVRAVPTHFEAMLRLAIEIDQLKASAEGGEHGGD